MTMSDVATPAATETPNAAVMVAVEPSLLEIKKKNELSAETFDQLSEAYRSFFAEVYDLLEQAKRVEVKDATEVTMIRHARELRLKLREQRVAADKLREQLKVDSNRRGNAIQSFFNLLKFKVEPIEEKLLAAEQFAERAEAKRLEELSKKRADELRVFVDPQHYDLQHMPEEQYQKLLGAARTASEADMARKKKEEDDRLAKEKADAEAREKERLEAEELKRKQAQWEAERKQAQEAREARAKLHRQRVDVIFAHKLLSENAISLIPEGYYGDMTDEKFSALVENLRAEKKERERLETDRLAAEKAKKEADAIAAKEKSDREAAAAKAAKERAEADAALKAQHDRELAAMRRKADDEAAARKKVEDEAAAALKKLADEATAKRVAEEAEKARAAAAPDRDKLQMLAAHIRMLELPELATDRAKEVAKTFRAQREKFASWVDKQAESLTSDQSSLNV